MKKNNVSKKLATITRSEINKVSGAEKFCDCMIAAKDLKITTIQDSEIVCKSWCCDSRHKVLNNHYGEFYIWDLESGSKWEGC